MTLSPDRPNRGIGRRLCATLLVGAWAPAALGQGFAISLDGELVSGDPRLAAETAPVREAIAAADVQVSFDGLGPERRLDFEIAGTPAPGGTVELVSALNYAAFVARAEFVVTDLAAPGGPREVAVLPVPPNGRVAFTLPEGDDARLVVRHRIYDAAGRTDETAARALGPARDDRDGPAEGNSSLAHQGIPAVGGAITVRGDGVAPGATVRVLGEPVAVAPGGGFVLQHILPAGTYGVDVDIRGGGQVPVSLVQDVTIPAAQSFSTGVVDLTFGLRRQDGGDWQSWDRGRIAAYVDGRRADGLTWRLSVDTTDRPLSEMFDGLADRDPRDILTRLDPRDLYPTYGDDSTIDDRTPTSGLIYARVSQGTDVLLWGDFRARLSDDGYAQSDRTLYGLQAHAEAPATTPDGRPRWALTGYAATPDRLPQRDLLRATGGAIYRLSRQDIAPGTETLAIQTRDEATGRILSTRTLTAGADYDLNAIQGLVILRRPVVTEGEGTEVLLVAQYEFTPIAGDLDGAALGARGEIALTDRLRVGLATTGDGATGARQTVTAADLVWQQSEGTWLRLDAARSDGPGFDRAVSLDGGLAFQTEPSSGGRGDALRLEGRADLADLLAAGPSRPQGAIAGYFERRAEGFSTLDHDVGPDTGDEELWGLSVEAARPSGLTYALAFDTYANAVGEHDRTGEASVTVPLRAGLDLMVGLEHEDRFRLDRPAGEAQGRRTDALATLTWAPSESQTVRLSASATLAQDGLDHDDRIALGATTDVGNGWTTDTELSAGTSGPGARLLASYDDGQGGTRYAGWTLDPDRDLDGVTLDGRDRGRFVLGGRDRIGARTAVFGESTYDLFGRTRSLSNAYGLTFDVTDSTRASATVEIGQVIDGADTDFDRTALSVGLTWDTERLQASTRLEARRDEGLRDGAALRSVMWLAAGDLEFRLDDERRLVASAEHLDSESDEGSIRDGRLTDITLGFAYRPVGDGRLNLLARYRYLHDLIGQRLDGTETDGPRQESHVLSADAVYRLSERWSVAGKLGYRRSDTQATDGAAFVANDAWLAATRLEWHVVNEWDVHLELRMLGTVQADTRDVGVVLPVYRHFGDNLMLGAGYNFGRFSDDLTDLVQDDEGLFVNAVLTF